MGSPKTSGQRRPSAAVSGASVVVGNGVPTQSVDMPLRTTYAKCHSPPQLQSVSVVQLGRPRKQGRRYRSGRLVYVPAAITTPHRHQHDKIERLADRVEHKTGDKRIVVDSLGNRGDPLIVVDLLTQFERAGEITAAQCAAGNEFRRNFRLAFYDRLAAADVSRPVVSGKIAGDPSNQSIAARTEIERTIVKLGGAATLGASAIWHVIGLEQTIREWTTVLRWSYSGCVPTADQACDILIGALRKLAA